MSNAVLTRRSATPSLDRSISALRDFFIDLAILLVSYLVATYFRREIPFGKYVGTNYRWQGPELYVTLAASLALVYAVSLAIDPVGRRGATSHFWTAVGGVAAACVGLAVFVPLQSGLEKGYFALCALLLIVLILPWPGSEQRMLGRPSLRESLVRLRANRGLLQIWVRYNVRSRYSQAFLGIFWIALLPLSTAFVMSVVFSQIMRIHIGVPFIAFFLAGFVPWGLFNQSVAASMRSIIGSMGLINQIYFPREIIVLSALGEALVDAFFMFIALMVIDAAVGIFPNGLWVVLPLLVAIQVVFSLGVMLIVSWMSVLVRDVPQLVSVALQILFYLSPIIYPVSIIPRHYQFLVTLNPIGVLIEAYHRIIVYGQPPDWSSLFYPAAFGIGLLVFGYRLFKVNEDRMADMV